MLLSLIALAAAEKPGAHDIAPVAIFRTWAERPTTGNCKGEVLTEMVSALGQCYSNPALHDASAMATRVNKTHISSGLYSDVNCTVLAKSTFLPVNPLLIPLHDEGCNSACHQSGSTIVGGQEECQDYYKSVENRSFAQMEIFPNTECNKSSTAEYLDVFSKYAGVFDSYKGFLLRGDNPRKSIYHCISFDKPLCAVEDFDCPKCPAGDDTCDPTLCCKEFGIQFPADNTGGYANTAGKSFPPEGFNSVNVQRDGGGYTFTAFPNRDCSPVKPWVSSSVWVPEGKCWQWARRYSAASLDGEAKQKNELKFVSFKVFHSPGAL